MISHAKKLTGKNRWSWIREVVYSCFRVDEEKHEKWAKKVASKKLVGTQKKRRKGVAVPLIMRNAKGVGAWSMHTLRQVLAARGKVAISGVPART